MMEYWNVDFLEDGSYCQDDLCLVFESHNPSTHYSMIPSFQHSNLYQAL
jgi:hypothetical protein